MLGAEASLRKPFTDQRLASTVLRALRSTASWRALGCEERCEVCDPESECRNETVARILHRALPLDIKLNAAVRVIQRKGDLTPAQTETATRMLWGDSNKQISERLGCSARAVSHHVKAVLEKLGVTNRASLLRVLLKDAGDIDPVQD